MEHHRALPTTEPERTAFLKQIEAEVRAECLLFRAKLPELMKTLWGRCVVFRNGQVQSDHSTMIEAYYAAVYRFGVYGGFMIDKVDVPRAIYISSCQLAS